MFFSVQDLELRKIHFDVDFPPGEIDFLDPALHQNGVLKANGVVELLPHTLGEIRIKGYLQAEVGSACDRCLEPAAFRIGSDFDLFYRPAKAVPDEEDAEIASGEEEIGFYEGDGLELEDVLREFILLALPMQMVCKPECKGICPSCGQNRNETACSCAVKAGDDRWKALRNLVS